MNDLSPQQVWDLAAREAKRMSELLPILQRIRQDPMEAAELIFDQMSQIASLQKQLLEVQGVPRR
jgi:hypothetical protein